MTTTTPPTNDLATIEQDTCRMIGYLETVTLLYAATNDADELRWLHRRVSKLTADCQRRRREAVQG